MGLSRSREADPDEIHDIFHVTDTFVQPAEWRRVIKQYIRSPESSTNGFDTFTIGSSPYMIYVLRRPEQKEQIRSLAYDQPQLSLCHAIFVFCTRTDFVLNIENLVEESFERASFRRLMNQFWNPYQPDPIQWAHHRTFMAVGYATMACEQEGISCSVMEGFRIPDVQQMLDLPPFLFPTAILAVGSPD